MGAERFDASIVSGVTPRGRLGDVKRAFIGTFWIQAESKPRPVDASLQLAEQAGWGARPTVDGFDDLESSNLAPRATIDAMAGDAQEPVAQCFWNRWFRLWGT